MMTSRDASWQQQHGAVVAAVAVDVDVAVAYVVPCGLDSVSRVRVHRVETAADTARTRTTTRSAWIEATRLWKMKARWRRRPPTTLLLQPLLLLLLHRSHPPHRHR